MLVFAAILPHPPILLPSVGSDEDRKKLKKTLNALDFLAEKFKNAEPDEIIISSPHPEWGIGVPLYFLARGFRGKIKTILIGLESPRDYFEEGKKLCRKACNVKHGTNKKLAIIASGDLSHCLKEDGPYGFHPDGPKFDKELIESLKKKDIENILNLDDEYPEAGECGLRSFCFLLGILEESGIDYHPEILSYEALFGVGYLVANFKIK